MSCCAAADDWQKVYTRAGVPFYVQHASRRTCWHNPHFLALLGALDDVAFVRRPRHRMALKWARLQRGLALESVRLHHIDDSLSAVLNTTISSSSSRGGKLPPSDPPAHQFSVEWLNCGALEAVAQRVCGAWPAALVDLVLCVLDPGRAGRVGLASLRVLLAAVVDSGAEPRLRFRYMVDAALTTTNNNNSSSSSGGEGVGEGVGGEDSLRLMLLVLARVAVVVGEAERFGPEQVDTALASCLHYLHRHRRPRHHSRQRGDRYRSVPGSVGAPLLEPELVLDWLSSDPPSLLAWLPTSYRLHVSQGLSHPVTCSVCGARPLRGACYTCVGCWRHYVCQQCFLYGRASAPHGRVAASRRHFTRKMTGEGVHMLREICSRCDSSQCLRHFWRCLRLRVACLLSAPRPAAGSSSSPNTRQPLRLPPAVGHGADLFPVLPEAEDFLPHLLSPSLETATTKESCCLESRDFTAAAAATTTRTADILCRLATPVAMSTDSRPVAPRCLPPTLASALALLTQLERTCRRLCSHPLSAAQCDILPLLARLRQLLLSLNSADSVSTPNHHHHQQQQQLTPPLAASTPHHALCSVTARPSTQASHIVSPIAPSKQPPSPLGEYVPTAPAAAAAVVTPDLLLMSSTAASLSHSLSRHSPPLSDCSLSQLASLPSVTSFGGDDVIGQSRDQPNDVIGQCMTQLAGLVARPISQWGHRVSVASLDNPATAATATATRISPPNISSVRDSSLSDSCSEFSVEVSPSSASNGAPLDGSPEEAAADSVEEVVEAPSLDIADQLSQLLQQLQLFCVENQLVGADARADFSPSSADLPV